MVKSGKRIIKSILAFAVVIGFAVPGFGQTNLSSDNLRSFTKNKYGGGAQNWAITKDKKNRIYVANNEGLLVFDGTKWQRFPVPNKTILRSIAFGANQKLYAGAQDELGYFAPDQTGKLCFTSLKDKLPLADRTFADVWEIEVVGSEVFFRTSLKIFHLKDNEFSIYPAASNWVSIKKHLGRVVALDSKQGLLMYNNGAWVSLIKAEQLPANIVITDILPYKNATSLVSTVSHGLFILSANDCKAFSFKETDFNSKQHLTCLLMIKDSTFLMGTYYEGLYHISSTGKIIENISAKGGLPNNTIRCIFNDNNGNIWTGLDNGIGYYSYDNAIESINPTSFKNGTGYGAAVLTGDVYFALSTGLYRLPFEQLGSISKGAIMPKTLMDGLTWNVSLVENQLLVGSDNGLWHVNKANIEPVSTSTGYWTTKVIPGKLPTQIVVGNYDGVEKYGVHTTHYTPIGRVNNFSESSRYVETDLNNIWVSHPYRGVYKIGLSDEKINLFSKLNGLPANLDNHVFKVKDRIVVATSAGIYEYDDNAKSMKKSQQFETIFGNLPIRYLKEDSAGNIWFVQEKMIGLVDFSFNKPRVQYIPELNNKIASGFENILPISNGNIIVGGEAGFYKLNYEKYKSGLKSFKAYVTQIKTTDKSNQLLFGGFQLDSTAEERPWIIPYAQNSVLFSYATTLV